MRFELLQNIRLVATRAFYGQVGGISARHTARYKIDIKRGIYRPITRRRNYR